MIFVAPGEPLLRPLEGQSVVDSRCQSRQIPQAPGATTCTNCHTNCRQRLVTLKIREDGDVNERVGTSWILATASAMLGMSLGTTRLPSMPWSAHDTLGHECHEWLQRAANQTRYPAHCISRVFAQRSQRHCLVTCEFPWCSGSPKEDPGRASRSPIIAHLVLD